jgi:hypothetical protein
MHAQEHFEDLQLSPNLHDDSGSSPAVDTVILPHTNEPASHLHSKTCESFDADEEIAKLISYFVNQGPRCAAQPSTARNSSVDTAAVALPPAVKFSRASRKAAAKPLGKDLN